jgi:hypothetical protein
MKISIKIYRICVRRFVVMGKGRKIKHTVHYLTILQCSTCSNNGPASFKEVFTLWFRTTRAMIKGDS